MQTTWRIPPLADPRRSQRNPEPTPEPHRPTDRLDMNEQIQQLPPFQRRLLNHVKQNASDEALRDACNQEAPLTIATDGGLRGRQGTFGWLICSSTNDVLYEGAGPVDGPFDAASSTRSELGGITAALVFYGLLIATWHFPPKCTYRWVCDSKAAISNEKRATDPVQQATK